MNEEYIITVSFAFFTLLCIVVFFNLIMITLIYKDGESLDILTHGFCGL